MKLSSLDKYQEIVIQMHDNPDADAIGSGYSLYKYFESKGKKYVLFMGKFKITKSNIVLLMEELKLPVEYVTSLDCPELLITVTASMEKEMYRNSRHRMLQLLTIIIPEGYLMIWRKFAVIS